MITKNKIGGKIGRHWKLSDETKKKQSAAAIIRQTKLWSNPTYKEKMRKSNAHNKPWLGKKRPDISGEHHHNWRGGVTPINEKIRKSPEYKLWRTAVFERDKYTCVWCKRSKEVSRNLNADHIKPFAFYPELRFAIDNGRTLCVPCHKTTDTYLWKGQKLLP